MEHTKHACMLPKPAGYGDEVHPTAHWWEQIRIRMRNTLLPCDWHYGTLVFLRSRKALEMERQRQIASGYWYIWHPYSPAKFYFECFLWVVNVFTEFYVPLEVFADCKNSITLFIFRVPCLEKNKRNPNRITLLAVKSLGLDSRPFFSGTREGIKLEVISN
ncbi:uncharacterized protein LOC125225488 [Leguminivora glycinivorella]|uniref:uncharacterized protein LOC125225488 n=1 Tax=Leguminivora glycinivorella TaxID=1035111 RepID=UPI00200D1492|nr:uncharacterized protein LOC125225488 [Leguminivora glycinivorella]